MRHRTPPKISSIFVDNFLSYPVDRQTDGQMQKHNLLGLGGSIDISLLLHSVIKHKIQQ